MLVGKMKHRLSSSTMECMIWRRGKVVVSTRMMILERQVMQRTGRKTPGRKGQCGDCGGSNSRRGN
jgi:hypothetical protein